MALLCGGAWALMRSSCGLWGEAASSPKGSPAHPVIGRELLRVRVPGLCTSLGCFSPEPPAPQQARAPELSEAGRGSREARKAEVGPGDLTFSREKVTWLCVATWVLALLQVTSVLEK